MSEALETQSRVVSYSPGTGEPIDSVPIADDKAVADAVVRARAAQPAWAARGIRERAQILRK